MPRIESTSATSTHVIRAARSPKEGRHDAPQECPRVAWSSKRCAGPQAKECVWDNAAARRWHGIPPRAKKKVQLVGGGGEQASDMWSAWRRARHVARARPSAAVLNLFLRPMTRYTQQSKLLLCFSFFACQETQVAFPEVTEMPSFLWQCGDRRARWRRGGGGSSALDKLCSRIINAMRLACRPDTALRHVVYRPVL